MPETPHAYPCWPVPAGQRRRGSPTPVQATWNSFSGSTSHNRWEIRCMVACRLSCKTHLELGIFAKPGAREDIRCYICAPVYECVADRADEFSASQRTFQNHSAIRTGAGRIVFRDLFNGYPILSGFVGHTAYELPVRPLRDLLVGLASKIYSVLDDAHITHGKARFSLFPAKLHRLPLSLVVSPPFPNREKR